MKNKASKQPEMLRSVNVYRVEGDPKGAFPNDRKYEPFKGSVSATIPELIEQLSAIYDLVLLHDPIDGCLLLNLQPEIKQRVTKLPCKQHGE